MFYYSDYFPLTFLPIALTGLYFLFEDRFANKQLRWLWWIAGGVLLLGVGYYSITEHALYDFFKGYYHGGRKILRAPDALYDEACYNYVNFPLLAYIFIPLANLPKEIAGRIFFAVGYTTLLPLAYWLTAFVGLKGGRRFLVLFFLLFNGPLDYSIWLGNTTQIIMLFVLLALFCSRKGWDWLSGILLGVAGLIKLPLILPSGYFFVKGKWKVVAGGLLVAGMAFILSMILVSPSSLNTIWLDRCILSMAEKPIGAYNNQSLSGFLARMYMPGNLGWDPLTPTPVYEMASRVGSFLLYAPVVAVLILGRKLPGNTPREMLEFFIVLLSSLLTSPIAWTHYFILLLIPFAWYLRYAPQLLKRSFLDWAVLVSVALISVPKDLALALFEKTALPVLLSLQFIGGVLFYGLLLMVWVQLRGKEYALTDG